MDGVVNPAVKRTLRFNALLLCMFAAWTVVVKFLNPLCLTWASASSGGPLDGPFIIWDFWWVAHLLLAYWFWRQKPRAWEFGIAMSLAEITITGLKFWLFLGNPLRPLTGAAPMIDRFLTAGWFFNRVCIFAFFVYLLLQLSSPSFRKAMRATPAARPT